MDWISALETCPSLSTTERPTLLTWTFESPSTIGPAAMEKKNPTKQGKFYEIKCKKRKR
jgi:hypothetical protein